MKLVQVGVLVLLFVVVLSPVPATADEGGCSAAANLYGVGAGCEFDSNAIATEKEKYPTAVWKATQICKDGKYAPNGDCYNPNICVTASGLSATEYTITRDGEYAGIACLTVEEAEQVAQPPMSVLVLEEFKRLKWPKSIVSVQPKGETLVNLETIFFTDNDQPTAVTVTLLSKQVTIRATPVSYAWTFGDGATLTTSEAGVPHSSHEISRRITHVYTTTETVKASVATTYSGRYRVGDGNWKDISETRTIPGPEVALEVLEATPQLVLE